MNQSKKILNNTKINNSVISIEELKELDITEETFTDLTKKITKNKIENIESKIENLSEELGENGIFITDDLRKYCIEISKYKVLSKEEEQDLLRKYYLGDKKSGEILINCNLRLVVNIAKKYNLTNCSSIDFMDLIQEGNLMLDKALKKFDIKKGTRFSTYATWWVKNKIDRTVREQSQAIKMSSYAAENLKKIKKYIEKYCEENKKNPSFSQIKEYLNVSTQELNIILRAGQSLVSMDIPLGEDEGFTLHEAIGNQMEISVEEQVTSTANFEYILDIMEIVLNERELNVILLGFGLEDGKEYNSYQIGSKMNLSHQRVKEIEKVALRKIKNRILYENKLKKVKRIINK